MEVPEHIYVGGGGATGPLNKAQNCPQMVVPHKITVGGGGTHLGHQGPPVEVLAANKIFETPFSVDTSAINGLPQTLTADEFRPLIEESVDTNVILAGPCGNINATDYNVSNLSSIAVDEDPLRELKNTRRQLKRLTARVMELERAETKRDGFLSWLKTGVVSNTLALAAILSFIFVQQMKRHQ